MSILYAIVTLLWPVLNSSLVNITDLMLWNVKDFILPESKHSLLSSKFGTEVSSSLCISCTCLGCWGVSCTYNWSLKLWHTTLKWFYFLHALHVFSKYQSLPMALWCTTVLTVVYLKLFIMLSGLLLSIYLSSLPLCMSLKSLTFFILSIFFLWLCASTLWATLAPVHYLFHSWSFGW